MKPVAIVQARMGSRRLPGKVMMTLGGKSVLGQVIARVRACARVHGVIVATTDSRRDNVVATESAACGAMVFRGDEHDVLRRYYYAAKLAEAEIIVRVTSDCPLLDSVVLGHMLDTFDGVRAAGQQLDYLSNTRTRSYPKGLDVEIFTFSALERAERAANRGYEREHVTPFIYRNPQLFALRQQVNDVDLSNYRWTLDTIEDLEFLHAVFLALAEDNLPVSMDSVMLVLGKKPELQRINANVATDSQPTMERAGSDGKV